MSVNDFDQFPDLGAIVITYRSILQEREDLQKELMTFLTGSQSDNGQIMAVFTEGARTILDKMSLLEQKQNDIQADMVQFAKILNGFKSIRELMDALRRAKTAVQNVGLEHKNVVKSALDRHPGMPLDDIQMLDDVRESGLKVDRVRAKNDPIVIDLEQRKKAANEILAKYNAEAVA